MILLLWQQQQKTEQWNPGYVLELSGKPGSVKLCRRSLESTLCDLIKVCDHSDLLNFGGLCGFIRAR